MGQKIDDDIRLIIFENGTSSVCILQYDYKPNEK